MSCVFSGNSKGSTDLLSWGWAEKALQLPAAPAPAPRPGSLGALGGGVACLFLVKCSRPVRRGG